MIDYGVQVQMQPPMRSSRLLLIFRGFLLVPHFIMLLVVGIVAAVLILVNYLVVLITGRAAFFGFLSGVLQYITRVTAYMYFLTDEYPPFSLGDANGYAVSVQVAPPGKIHRWRIFSYLLLIPHLIVLYLMAIVAAVCAFLAWWAVLFTGRYPAGLFGVVSGVVAYQARLNGYMYLITDTYPPFSFS